jgi:hypothetical protein
MMRVWQLARRIVSNIDLQLTAAEARMNLNDQAHGEKRNAGVEDELELGERA